MGGRNSKISDRNEAVAGGAAQESNILPFNLSECKANKSRFLMHHRHKGDDGGIYFTKIFCKSSKLNDERQCIHSLRELQKRLGLCAHASIITEIGETDQCIYYVRPHYFTTLSDRISSKPSLSEVQKKWITYQLLYYLVEAQKHDIFHGDLKPKNIMLSSCNWVYIVDHAVCYKPVCIFENDSRQFSHFFNVDFDDCYAAPERFCLASRKEEAVSDGQYRFEMDVFSMGCIIAELWLNEYGALFNYDTLLLYKRGKVDLLKELCGIQDEFLRQMVLTMLCVDPIRRASPVECLESAKKAWLPPFFDILYTFLAKINGYNSHNKIKAIHCVLPGLEMHLRNLEPIPLLKEPKFPQNCHSSTAIVLARSLEERAITHFTRMFKVFEQPFKLDLPLRQIRVANSNREKWPFQVESRVIVDRNPNCQKDPPDSNPSSAPIQCNFRSDKIHQEATSPEYHDDRSESELHTISMDDEIWQENDLSVQKNQWYKNLHGSQGPFPTDEKQKVVLGKSHCGDTRVGSGFELIVDFLRPILFFSLELNAKMMMLDCLMRVSEYVEDGVLLHVIIPYIVNLMDLDNGVNRERSAVIRSGLFETLVFIVSKVKILKNFEDLKLFVNVVLPLVSSFLECETEELVMYTYADAIPLLVSAAKNFLDRVNFLEGVQQEQSREELCVSSVDDLKKYFLALIVDGLLCREVTPVGVKRSFLRAITLLSDFFGHEITNNTIIPFIFSFVDGNEKELICEAFDCIALIGSTLAFRSVVEKYIIFVIPLAIYKRSEYTIYSTLKCLLRLIKVRVFTEQSLICIVDSILPLILHPNFFIRRHVNSIITATFYRLDLEDHDKYLIAKLTPYLKEPNTHQKLNIQELKKLILPNISRHSYNRVLNSGFIPSQTNQNNPTFESILDKLKLGQNDYRGLILMRKYICGVISNANHPPKKSKSNTVNWSIDYYKFITQKMNNTTSNIAHISIKNSTSIQIVHNL